MCVRHVHRCIYGRTGFFYAVSYEGCVRRRRLTDSNNPQDKRRPLLFFGKVGTRASFCPCKLDHRLGKRDRPSHPRVLYRLYCVRSDLPAFLETP